VKNAVILHGRPDRTEYFDPAAPSMSNAHWLPWLQGQLLKADIDAATPEVPHSYDLNWKTWQREVERFDIGPQTILVGHSTGGGFLVKYLSIKKELSVGKVVLVAPWLDPFQEHVPDFFNDFEIAPDLVQRTAGLTIFHSDNDQKGVQGSVDILREKLDRLKYREFHNHGHFCSEDLKTTEFPELLAEVLMS
jgi:predicted alpha/beta hydrolase family esterase